MNREMRRYEAPAVVLLGSVHEVTLGPLGDCADVALGGNVPSVAGPCP